MGLGGHQTHSWINDHFGNGWKQLVAHTIGVFIAYPCVVWFARNLEADKKEIERLSLAWFLGFFWVGLGTLVGWILEPQD